MTVYHLCPGMDMAAIPQGYYVKAEDLRELLLRWGADLNELPGLSPTSLRTADEMLTERLSLHCEPELPPEEWSYRGDKVKDMSRDRLVEVAELLCEESHKRQTTLYGLSKE